MVMMFFYSRWGVHIYEDAYYRKEKLVVLAYSTAMVIGFVVSYVKEKRQTVFLKLNLTHFALVISLFTIELFFSSFPGFLPKRLFKVAPHLDPVVKEIRKDILEYLPENPWVKFKPNTVIELPKYRGEDFVYHWTTDSLGFKNRPEMAANPDVKAIAIGDSLVEAMGVPLEKTWCSLATDRGFPVYNLGVEGFAPQQMVGVLEKYGRHFRPDTVFFGYTPGFEVRTLHFTDPKHFIRGKRFTGAIESMNQYKKAETSHFKILNALFDLLKDNIQQVKTVKKRATVASKSSVFSAYDHQVEGANKSVFGFDGLAWKLTLQSILEAKEIAREMSSTLVVLLFCDRRFVYYERVMGQAAPKDHSHLQVTDALKEFCRENDIEIIDTYPAMKSYMQNLSEPVMLEKLPYFKQDGHMNEIGQEIIAKAATDYLRKTRR